MNRYDNNTTRRNELRKRAEDRLDNKFPNNEVILDEDAHRLVYELHTYQIELEMQNEELRLVQQELLEARDRYIGLYDLAPVGYLTMNAQGLILESNLTFAKMIETERQQLIKQPLSAYVAQQDQDVYYLFNMHTREKKTQQTCELRMSAYNPRLTGTDSSKHAAGAVKDGLLWVQLNSRPLLDAHGEVDKIYLSISDINDFKQATDKLEHLATYDQLTFLPNRYLLETELNQHINSATRFEEKLAVLFIDLDNFKVINDTMGHEQGDMLLKMVAKRLSTHLRKYDTVSRFGGDEFVLLMTKVRDTTDVASVADKINKEFCSAFRLKKQQAFVTASIGISVFPEDGHTAGELLQHADAAMYKAKDAGRNRYCFFTRNMNDELRRHHFIASQLRYALAHRNFSLYYQPKVDSYSGNIICCEALLRWFPVSKENISPAEFIPIAEKSELINKIGEWVIDEACRQSAEWKQKGVPDFRIDINLSGRQFLQHDIFQVLGNSLTKYHLTEADIGIELTENVLIDAGEDNLSNLRSLHAAGMQISIDDFGTGYSSLSYLRRFPVHILKIDQEFIKEAPENEDDRAIMEAIVAVGHRLGLKVVVEGVETEEQHRLAQEIGCDVEQGFFFYEPMQANELFTILTSQFELA